MVITAHFDWQGNMFQFILFKGQEFIVSDWTSRRTDTTYLMSLTRLAIKSHNSSSLSYTLWSQIQLLWPYPCNVSSTIQHNVVNTQCCESITALHHWSCYLGPTQLCYILIYPEMWHVVVNTQCCESITVQQHWSRHLDPQCLVDNCYT
jgi:hypothetical protein